MNVFNYVVLLYLAIQITNGTLTKYLINQHITGSVVLLFRAGFCLLFVLVLAALKRESLIPKTPKIQSIRIVLAGVGLLLITKSYAHLNATSVAFVSRMDMLLVIIVTCILSGKLFAIKNIIMCVMFLLCLFFISIFKNPNESMQGIFMALAGTACVVTGYFLIKSVVEKENALVITGVACIGSILMSSGDIVINGIKIIPENNLLWLAFFVEGICMFLLYTLTVRLYRVMSLESAQFLALVGTFLTIPFEYLFAGSHFEWSYVIGLFLMVVVVATTLFYFGKEESAA